MKFYSWKIRVWFELLVLNLFWKTKYQNFSARTSYCKFSETVKKLKFVLLKLIREMQLRTIQMVVNTGTRWKTDVPSTLEVLFLGNYSTVLELLVTGEPVITTVKPLSSQLRETSLVYLSFWNSPPSRWGNVFTAYCVYFIRRTLAKRWLTAENLSLKFPLATVWIFICLLIRGLCHRFE